MLVYFLKCIHAAIKIPCCIVLILGLIRRDRGKNVNDKLSRENQKREKRNISTYIPNFGFQRLWFSLAKVLLEGLHALFLVSTFLFHFFASFFRAEFSCESYIFKAALCYFRMYIWALLGYYE